MPKFKCCNSAQLAAIFFLLAVVLAHIGHRVTERHITLLQNRTQGLFATLIPLERQRIAAWRREREADINHYARSPAAAAALGPVLERPNDGEARRRASDWFARMRAVHPEYTGVTLAGPAGSVALRVGSAPPPPDDRRRLQALESGTCHWGDLTALEGLPAWDVFVGLGSGRGVAVFRVDPRGDGLPSLSSDLMRGSGGVDVVLARPDGSGATVLDHDPARPGFARLYAAHAASTVREALDAVPGVVVDGEDHLGRRVFATTGILADGEWRLLFLREAGGAVAHARQLMAVSGLGGAAAVAACFLLVSYIYRRREEESAQTASRLDALLEQAPDPVLLFAPDGRVLDVNEAAIRTYGYTREEFRALSAFDLRADRDRDQGSRRIGKVLEEGRGDFIAPHARKSGERCIMEVHSRRIETSQGPIVQAMMRDVSQRVETENRLLKQARLHAALSSCASSVTRASGRDALAKELCRILTEEGAFRLAIVWFREPGGQALRATANLGAEEVVPPGGLLPLGSADPSLATATEQAFRTGRTVVVDDIRVSPLTLRMREAGLKAGIRSLVAHPIRSAGETVGVLTVCDAEAGFFSTDAAQTVATVADDVSYALDNLLVAERAVVSAQALAETRRLQAHINEALPVGVYIFDARRGANVYGTPSLERILMRPIAEVQEKGPRFFLENLHPEDRGVFDGYAGRFQSLPAGQVVESTYRLRRGDGEWRWFHSRDVVFERLPDGSPKLILGSLEDVTELVETRRKLEAALAEHRRIAHAVEYAAESIVITDSQGVIEYINPAACRITGYSREEAVGRHTRGLKSGVHPPEFYKELWGTIAAGRVWNGHLVNRRKDGSLFEEDASIAPVVDGSGRITNFVAVKKDVTNERSLESQLRQAQKLEAVGRLAGGVAHDFNNILTAISGYAQLLRSSLPPGSPQADDLAEIEKGARRAADLTRQLLIFSRKQAISPRVFDPAELASGLQKMLRRIVGEDVHLRYSQSTHGGRIKADPGQFEQVLLNFVVNARDAMPKGGDIVIEVAEERLAEPRPGVDGRVPPGRYCVVSVADTGCGIPPEVLPRIFEPFFTTKGDRGGTGLGLSTVYGIVKQAGAFLTAESRLERGTRMGVYWPLAEAGGEEAPSPADEEPAAGTEAVALVEDEEAVRGLAARILAAAGYDVKAFPDARSALAWLAAPGASWDLLLTDVLLPGGMNGRELADEARRLRPAAKSLFVSGYSDEALSTKGVLDPGLRLLQKPFTREGLLRAVREALDGP